MFRGRWKELGVYGGLGPSVNNTRLFGRSQLGGYGAYGAYGSYGSYGGYGEVGVSTLLLTALVI